MTIHFASNSYCKQRMQIYSRRKEDTLRTFSTDKKNRSYKIVCTRSFSKLWQAKNGTSFIGKRWNITPLKLQSNEVIFIKIPYSLREKSNNELSNVFESCRINAFHSSMYLQWLSKKPGFKVKNMVMKSPFF